MDLIQILSLAFLFGWIPCQVIIQYKLGTKRGLFGKHSCDSFSVCLRFAKYKITSEWDRDELYCKKHYKECIDIKKMVDKCANGEINGDDLMRWRGHK